VADNPILRHCLIRLHPLSGIASAPEWNDRNRRVRALTPVHVVAKRLGHDASVLLKVYAKRTQKSDESAAATIGAMTKGLSI
jgi:hypothetical protein